MISRNKYLKIIIPILIIVSYLCMSSYILFGIFGMNHDMNHSKMEGCTYVIGQDVVCSLDVFGFINKWKENSSVTLPFYNMLFFASVVAFYFSIFFIPPLIFRLLIYLNKKIKIQSLFQILYGDGILNSKAF